MGDNHIIPKEAVNTIAAVMNNILLWPYQRFLSFLTLHFSFASQMNQTGEGQFGNSVLTSIGYLSIGYCNVYIHVYIESSHNG